jgi:hypothetical protein
LIGISLVLRKKWIWAATVFNLADLLGLGATAFVYDAARPKLHQIDWFRRFHGTVVKGKDWLYHRADMFVRRIDLFQHLMTHPARAARFFRLLAVLRRRARPA